MPVHAFYKSSYALCFGSFMYFESSPFGHTFSYSQPFRILGHISECPHPFFESLHTFQLLLLSPTLLFPIVFEFYCVFFDTSETFLAASNCLIRFYTHFKSSYVFQIFTFFQVLFTFLDVPSIYCRLLFESLNMFPNAYTLLELPHAVQF